jgi:hypothetical protein
MRKLFLTATLLVLAGAAEAASLTEKIDRTFDVRPGANVQLTNVNGRITVKAWDQPRVKVVALDVTPRGETSIDRYMLSRDPVVSQRSFPTLCDEKGLVASRYSASETPTFVLIDTHGVVRYRGAFAPSSRQPSHASPASEARLGVKRSCGSLNASARATGSLTKRSRH